MPIHQTAYFVVRDDALEACKQVIREFVDYVRANEPETLLYTSLQEKENPNHFLHYFIFRDENARQLHSNSEAVSRFTGILYPNLVAPVEFTEFEIFATTSWHGLQRCRQRAGVESLENLCNRKKLLTLRGRNAIMIPAYHPTF